VAPKKFSELFLKVLHRPLTAPLVAKLAPPVAPPNENVWLRPCHLHIVVALGGHFEGKLLNYDVVRKILYERIIHFSPKRRNICTRNTFMGAPKKGRDEASASLAFP